MEGEVGVVGVSGRWKAGRFIQTMARRPEVICLLMALSFTFMSRCSNSLNKQDYVSQPIPQRFFPASSPVLDFPYGNLQQVADLLVEEEVLFIMYYAPWCSQSMYLRKEFEKAARYLANEVQFVAVNCWYPEGNCRKQNNFLRYPLFFFYHTSLDGFRYQGTVTAEELIHFVERMSRPLSYISSDEDLALFLAQRDNAVIGFFDFNAEPQPPGFQQFYFGAMRTRERDPRNSVEFGLITNRQLALRFEMTRSRTIFLTRCQNTTLKFPLLKSITSSNLAQWVFTFRQEPVVTLVNPAGLKSVILSSELIKGPSMILFTPQHPLSGVNYDLSLLREIALDYYNCQNRSHIMDMVESSKYIRWHSAARNVDLLSACRQTRPDPAQDRAHSHSKARHTKQCCQTWMGARSGGGGAGFSYDQRDACELCLNYHPGHWYTWRDECRTSSLTAWHALRMRGTLAASRGRCVELMPSYNPSEVITLCCGVRSGYNQNVIRKLPSNIRDAHSSTIESIDPYIIDSLRDGLKDQCWKLRHQRTHMWLPVMHSYDVNSAPSQYSGFSGLGCKFNRTLQFLAMDTRWSHLFAQRLGLRLTPLASHSALVLYDNDQEAQYVYKEGIRKEQLVSFISNFTDGGLERHLRSATQLTGTVTSECNGDVIDQSDVCVVDVTADTFQKLVIDNNKDVVLLYYAPWCGFCAGFAHVYLSLAKYFKSTKDVMFARINGDSNDLSWEFTADVYPTITLFPAHGKEDSVTFPDHLRKTLPNLIRFVLRYGGQSLRLETGLSICSRTCMQANTQSAAARIHGLYGGIHLIQQRTQRVRDRLEDYRRLQGGERDATKRAVYEARTHVLQWYLWLLERRLATRQLQQKNARVLHRALLTSRGYHIERHKLLALLQRYDVYRQRLDELGEGLVADGDYWSGGEEQLGGGMGDEWGILEGHDILDVMFPGEAGEGGLGDIRKDGLMGKGVSGGSPNKEQIQGDKHDEL